MYFFSAWQDLISLLFSALAVLSSTGGVLIFAYLISTERSAPHILEHSRHRSSEQEPSTSSKLIPLVSIIITARNEERTISDCTRSLLNQTYSNFELIIVDDCSSDNTLEIASSFQADARVRVVEAGPKPDGWVGKSWPCHRGYKVAQGTVLLYVDADSVFEKTALDVSVNRMLSLELDMFSISPKVRLKGIWALSLMPLISGAINLLYPMSKVNDPKNKRAYVFGTFVLVRNNVYEEIGGHEGVRDRIVEDAALAQAAKSKGCKLRVEVGDNLIKTSWESDRKSVYHGLERMISESARSYGTLSILNAVVLFFVGLYPLIYLIGFLLLSVNSDIFASTTLLTGLVASVISILLAIAIGSNELAFVSNERVILSIFYPLGFCLFISAIVTASLKVGRSGKFMWKGTEYQQRLDSPKKPASRSGTCDAGFQND